MHLRRPFALFSAALLFAASAALPCSANAQGGRNAPAATVPLTEVTPITEIPRNKPVLIQGVITAAHPTLLTLNDGNASIVIQLGKNWQDLTGAKIGDRIRAIGQIDPYGTGLFRAGSLVMLDGRVIVIP